MDDELYEEDYIDDDEYDKDYIPRLMNDDHKVLFLFGRKIHTPYNRE